jgi:hypothetical protein
MFTKEKFPNFQFVLIALVDFLVSFYLLKQDYSPMQVALFSIVLLAVVLSLMIWGYGLRLRLTIKRLLRRNIIGEQADEILERKKKSMVQSYYGTLATLFIIAIIVRFFSIPDLQKAPLWQYIIIVGVAFGVPDLFFYGYNKLARKRVG